MFRAILRVLRVRAHAVGTVGNHRGYLATSPTMGHDTGPCAPRVVRCRRPAGWGPPGLPGGGWLPLAGTLGPVALVAQGIEQRFPKLCVPDRLCDGRLGQSKERGL